MKIKYNLPLWLIAANSLILTTASFAVSATWNRNGNGLWTTSGNWTSGIRPNGAGDEAHFINDINADRTVTITSDRTVGILTLGDANATHGFTLIDDNEGESIIFNNNGLGAQLNESGAPVDELFIHIALQDNLTINSSGSLIVSSGISGDFAITKTGSGLLNLFSNSYFTGGTIVLGGDVGFSSRSSFGTGNITLNGGNISNSGGEGFSRSLGSGDEQIQITGGISGFSGNGHFGLGDITWGSTHFNPSEFVYQSNLATSNSQSSFDSSIDLGGADRVIRSDQPGGNIALGYGNFIGNITGSGKLTKVGAGQHVFSGINTYSGGTVIESGTLRFDHREAMPAIGTVAVQTGATIGIGVAADQNSGYWSVGTSGYGTIGGLLSGLGGQDGSTVTFAGDVGLLLKTNEDATYSGDINNASATNLSLLIANDLGITLTLSGMNSYTGSTQLLTGTLSISSLQNAGSPSSIGAYATAGPGGLFLGETKSESERAIFSYTGSTTSTNRGFTLLDSATINISGSSVALTLGDFYLENSGSLTTQGGAGSTLTLGNTILDKTDLSLIADVPTQVGHIDITGAARSISNDGTSALTVGSVNLSSNLTLQGGMGEITGEISGTGSLTKGGANTTWTLSGASTYSGITTVSGGTLRVNNVTGSATGSGAVTVGSNGIMAGTGAISGTVAVSGVLSPGNASGDIASLAVGSTTWNGGTRLWEFDLSANSGVSDQLSILGDFIKGSGSSYTFDFMGSSPNAAGHTYTLATWTGNTTFLPTNFSFQGLTGSFTEGTFSMNSSSLQFTTVPEPSSSLAGILIAFGLMRRTRKLQTR